MTRVGVLMMVDVAPSVTSFADQDVGLPTPDAGR
jgi:hypothetical protein